MLTGIGGQGIQLAAQVLARAAIAEGRQVQMFGSYGGMMRGGNTEATLVLADGAIEAPPTVTDTWSAIFMHHDFSAPTRAKLRAGSLVFVNTSLFEGEFEGAFDHDEYRVVELAATDIVTLDSVDAAIAASLPAYRSQHVARNVDAVRAGFDVAPRAIVSAWNGVPA